MEAIISKYHYFILYRYNPFLLMCNEIDCILMCGKFSIEITIKKKNT